MSNPADDRNDDTPEVEANDVADNLTDAELAAQQEDGDGADDAAGAADGADGGSDGADDASASAAGDDGQQDDAAAAAAADTPAEPQAAAAPVEIPIPDPPKDFAAELAKLEEQYENGDLETDAYNKAMRDLNREEARYEGRVEAIKAANELRQSEFQAAQQQTWNQAAAEFEAANAEFLANPLRKKAMQEAIATVDQQTEGKLPPAELLARAGKIAYEAYGLPMPGTESAGAGKDAQAAAAKKRAEALAGRKPDGKPPKTLGQAPTAAAERGSDRFGDVDSLSHPEMEEVVAGMSADQLDKFLREADAG